MSIHDRDYYRDEVAAKTGGKRPPSPQTSNILNGIIAETAKHPRRPSRATLFKRPMLLTRRYEPVRTKQGLPKPVIFLIWICVVAVLYGAFKLAKH